MRSSASLPRWPSRSAFVCQSARKRGWNARASKARCWDGRDLLLTLTRSARCEPAGCPGARSVATRAWPGQRARRRRCSARLRSCGRIGLLVLVSPVEILLLFVLASHVKIFVVVVVLRLPPLVNNSLVIVPGVIVAVVSIVHTVMITAAAKR